MGYCKDCVFYGTVDDYYRLGRWVDGCVVKWEPIGLYGSCDLFVDNTNYELMKSFLNNDNISEEIKNVIRNALP
jgi:hypothetical protein